MFLSDTLHLYNRNTGDISIHDSTSQDVSKHDDTSQDISKHDDDHDISKYCTARPIKVENDPDTVDHRVPAITMLKKKKTSDPREFFEKLYGPDPPKDYTRVDHANHAMGDHPNLVYPLTPPSLLHHNSMAFPWPGGLQAFCE